MTETQKEGQSTPAQQQRQVPGRTAAMDPKPDHGEQSYRGSDRLAGKAAIEEKVKEFGKQVPMKRPGQPAEVAPPYVMLAADEASYISGATIAVTGGAPML
ncbi:MAG TPA: SDR family oxidoreductase [Paraburkholderia sp.]|nr:SDR family oxidoreductase [Paraburkholderia sp.]